MGIFVKRKNAESNKQWAIDDIPAKQEIAVVKKSFHMYCMVGSERCDYLYYLVKIGLMAGKRIMVIDNSYEHAFFDLVQKDDNETIIVTDSLIACCDYRIRKEQMKDMFDVVYVWLGHNYNGVSDYEADCTIYLTSPERAEISYAKKAFEKTQSQNEMQRIFILRDQCSRKVTAQSAKKLCGMTTDGTFEIPWSVDDYAAYVGLTHNRSATFKSLSSALYDLILDLSLLIYEIPEKTLKRMMK